MKKVLKITGIVLTVLVLAVAGVVSYVKFALPDVGPPPELTVERTPERVKHGEYLTRSVLVCLHCHSGTDANLFTAPVALGKEGSGGEVFPPEEGFPGRFVSANLTPVNLGDWTDGELYRAITTGVNKHGKTLFPLMPYDRYGKMDPEDVKSVIAYLRTLPSVGGKTEPSEPAFPFSLIMNTIPKKAEPMKRPNPSDTLAYGEYLVSIAPCYVCHTPVNERQENLTGMDYAGGRAFPLRTGGTVYSSNISPDPETGIGKWSKAQFIARFKAYADSSAKPAVIGHNQFNTMMSWYEYAKMSEEDLGAIYTYLRTVKPQKNAVVKFKPGGEVVATK